jgi:hypothetical protein
VIIKNTFLTAKKYFSYEKYRNVAIEMDIAVAILEVLKIPGKPELTSSPFKSLKIGQ